MQIGSHLKDKTSKFCIFTSYSVPNSYHNEILYVCIAARSMAKNIIAKKRSDA
jgi:hypothetical protein